MKFVQIQKSSSYPFQGSQIQQQNDMQSLYKKKIYKISKKKYRIKDQLQQDYISKNSLITYIKGILSFIRSVQLMSLFRFLEDDTLDSKYRHVSLAILNNSVNLDSAVLKALEYNIPLIQIIMRKNNSQQEQIIVENILKNFAVSHFINQNFVLFGDWSYEKYQQIFREQGCEFPQSGFIVFRKAQYVFAQIKINTLSRIDHNKFQQILLQIRDRYYNIKPSQFFFSFLKEDNINDKSQQQKNENQQDNEKKDEGKLEQSIIRLKKTESPQQQQVNKKFISPTKSQKIVNQYLMNNEIESDSQRGSPRNNSQESSSKNQSSFHDDKYKYEQQRQ